ncbi:uncharacterized protein LOC102809700 [Saccoglossus kowalevskii]
MKSIGGVVLVFCILYQICAAEKQDNVINVKKKPKYCHEFALALKQNIDFNFMEIQCEKDGTFSPTQCLRTGMCACVNMYGNYITYTATAPNQPPPECKGLKPGRCPFTNTGLSCDIKCQHDAECPFNHKCCNTDCGMTCLEPKQDCYPDEFVCDDGVVCISEYQVCDGLPDCIDGSDESPSRCTEPRFECDFDRMIPIHFVCDGYPQCPDGSDELNCEDFDFVCTNGNIVKQVSVCNGYDNCADGSDESGCEPQAECNESTI